MMTGQVILSLLISLVFVSVVLVALMILLEFLVIELVMAQSILSLLVFWPSMRRARELGESATGALLVLSCQLP